jgi:ketosteroid isomerase-like protein
MPRIRRFLKNVRLGFPDGLRVEFTGVTAEGERVAVEAVSSARMSDGRPYENHYHFLVQVRDGRVVQVREYLDTQFVHELQLTLRPPAS